ncbi:MAG: ribose-phosphate pyrophosphokinase [Succinivibrionaceae bacterium]|nr:ribose-phosphate pyrophosphokinase [Succinivibrionaceae bacterium]
MSDMRLFAGNATPELAGKIAARLKTKLGDATVDRFSDGEVHVQINENVRGCDVFVIQSTCAPTNDNLMELLVMIDALRRASAGRITAVIPYFGYARQDRRVRSARVPITAKVVADFLSSVGIDRVITVDLHAEQIQGFFDVPIDNLFGSQVLIEDLKSRTFENPVIVSPDMGGVVRARAMAKLMNDIDIAIIDKRRPRPNVSQVMNIIGEVDGRECIIIDDMVDTGGTLCHAADALKERGAKSVVAYATHPVLSGKAAENITGSKIDEIVVTDSIPLTDAIKETKKVRSLSLAPMLAEAIRRINNEESISAMFDC